MDQIFEDESKKRAKEVKFLDLEEIIKKKNPRLLKLLPGFLIRYFKRVIHQDDLNGILQRHAHLTIATDKEGRTGLNLLHLLEGNVEHGLNHWTLAGHHGNLIVAVVVCWSYTPRVASHKSIAMYENICNSIHLPIQSGSSRILKMMNRKYTREFYLERVRAIRHILPDCSISTDFITGFCSETEEDHQETLSLMKEVGFDFAYMFKYSERPNTNASRHLLDDVPEEIKTKRLSEIIAFQNKLSESSKKKDVGKSFEILIEGESKRSPDYYYGRTSQNKVTVFPKDNSKIGDYVFVIITECTSATLIGHIIEE